MESEITFETVYHLGRRPRQEIVNFHSKRMELTEPCCESGTVLSAGDRAMGWCQCCEAGQAKGVRGVGMSW